MIELAIVIRSRNRTKNPTPTLSAVRNPTPPKTSDSLRLRNPACNDTLFPAITLTLHKATGQ